MGDSTENQNNYLTPRRVSSTIGSPTKFTGGPFQSSTIRTEMVELQKADFTRKFTHKDRRPLDPPPVVKLQIFEVFDHEIGGQHEAPLKDIVPTFGLLCHVDLFPVPEVPPQTCHCPTQGGAPTDVLILPPGMRRSSPPARPYLSLEPGSMAPQSGSRGPSAFHPSTMAPLLGLQHPEETGWRLPPISTLLIAAESIHRPPDRLSAPMHLPQQGPMPPAHQATWPPEPAPPEEVVAYYGDHAITEGSKLTSMLVGGTCAQAIIVKHNERDTLMFVFSDLSVQMEGTFILRYRAFTAFSPEDATGASLPVLGECYGGPFKVYSSGTFPGLKPSTDLTKDLSLHGVRLNVRETERKRAKLSDAESSPEPRGGGPSRRGSPRRDLKGKARARGAHA